jgi:hypothetical protein
MEDVMARQKTSTIESPVSGSLPQSSDQSSSAMLASAQSLAASSATTAGDLSSTPQANPVAGTMVSSFERSAFEKRLEASLDASLSKILDEVMSRKNTSTIESPEIIVLADDSESDLDQKPAARPAAGERSYEIDDDDDDDIVVEVTLTCEQVVRRKFKHAKKMNLVITLE